MKLSAEKTGFDLNTISLLDFKRKGKIEIPKVMRAG
jgi:hypothetical protein